MPSWKKVIISGSNAELSSLYAPSITGSLQGTAAFALSSSRLYYRLAYNDAEVIPPTRLPLTFMQSASAETVDGYGDAWFNNNLTYDWDNSTLYAPYYRSVFSSTPDSVVFIGTASAALTATSASFAVSASRAVTASFALTASAALTAVTASYFNAAVVTTGSGTDFSLYSTSPMAGNSGTRLPLSGSITFGYQAGYNSSASVYVNLLGYRAGYQTNDVSYSNFLGNSAGSGADNADQSQFIGYRAGYLSTGANNSVFIGYLAGQQQASASYSTIIGNSSGRSGSWGALGINNIIIGTNISLPNGYANYANIGGVLFISGTYGTTSGNNLTGSQANGRIGIGIVNPSASLHITNTSNANSFLVEDATNPDNTPFLIDNAGNVMIGTTSSKGEVTIAASGADGLVLDTDASSDTNSSRIFLKNSGSGRDISLRNSGHALYIGHSATAGTTSGPYAMIISGSGVSIGNNYTISAARGALLQVSGSINIEEGFAYKQDGFDILKSSRGNVGTSYDSIIGGVNAASGSAYIDAMTAYGYTALQLSSGSSQTAVGYSAGRYNTGSDQTLIGWTAGMSASGAQQTAIGRSAGYGNISIYQTVVGYNAGYFNLASYQTAMGGAAGAYNLGLYQSAYGYQAGYENSGSSQSAFGYLAGFQNSGSNQTAVGQSAGYQNTATQQTAVGLQAGYLNIGIAQTALGQQAGQNNSGSTQTAVGYAAGFQNSGSLQVAIGANAGRDNKGANQTATGYEAGRLNTADNQSAYGYDAGYQNTGISQTAIGVNAGYQNSGSYQTTMGLQAGYQNSASYQTAVGINAGRNNSGSTQTAVGNEAGRLNRGTNQTSIGSDSGYRNTAVGQVAVGAFAGYENSGSYQVALGNSAGVSNTGSNQVAVGYQAGRRNTQDYQTAVGFESGYFNTGLNQSAFGWRAGYQNSGSSQTAIGVSAGYQNTALNQTAIGVSAGYENSGAYQTAVGNQAGYQNSGSNQTAVGYNAGFQNSGSDNTNVGYRAGYLITLGTVNSQSAQSVFLGSETRAQSGNQTNQIVIGYNAIGIGSNSVVLGNSSITTTALRGFVGIGTTTPTASLHVNNTTNSASFLVEDSTNPDTTPFIIDALGNVGIGTTTPTTKLHVSGNAGAVNWVGTDHIYQQFYPSGLDAGRFGYIGYGFSGSTQLNITNEVAGGNLALGTAGNASRLFISAAGNVGINTTTPTYTLQIHAAPTASIRLQETGSGGNKRLDLTIDASGVARISANQSAQQMAFDTVGGERLRITKDGDIGINKTTPNATLDVSGSAIISGSLTTTSSVAFKAYTSPTSFVGTPVGYLAFDSVGSILTVGGITATPAGTTTQLQYNNAGVLAGTSAITFNGTTLVATGSFTGSLVGELTGTASFAAKSALSDVAAAVTVQNTIGSGTYYLTMVDSQNTPLADTEIVSTQDLSYNGLTGVLSFFNGVGTVDATATRATSASFLTPDTNAFIQNGNGFGTTALLGTTDNNALQFETNNTVKMHINADGNVGINTTTPNAKLDVNGNTIITGSFTVTGSYNSPAGNTIDSNALIQAGLLYLSNNF